ncbi:MAG: hypothetical protein FWH38_02905 [Treponema sp.]|nr:hypothetical protein [Treponema sp.]
MERVEEFSHEGKDFVYINFSGLNADDSFLAVIDQVKQVMVKYPEKSVYTITDIDNIKFDTLIKNDIIKYLEFNKTYVKYGAIIGIDGIKKMLAQSVMKLSGRTNFNFCFTKEEAVKWLLQQG